MLQKIKRVVANAWVKRITVFLFASVIIHITYISIDGNRNYHGRADVAIILGNHVYADGRLSPWLKGRVDKALDLYRQGRVKKIFASGGISENPEGNYPEADAMKAYLVAKGVPAADIIADNQGINTYCTAKNFIDWNQSQHYNNAIVVSQFFHITRCKYIMHKLGFIHVYSAASGRHTFNDVMGTLREVPALYKYMLVY